jgi:hypothetical protein
MKNYPSIQSVTLREFYVRRTEARPATITRAMLEKVEETLALRVMELDRCLAAGAPKRLTVKGVGPWRPTPGLPYCRWCAASHRCPIERDAREKYVISTPDAAEKAAGELVVANAVREHRRDALGTYTMENGPVPIKGDKQHRYVGMRTDKSGNPSLTIFTPTKPEDLEPPRKPEDGALEKALKKATKRAREARAA